MIETCTLQGRRIGPLELAQVRAFLAEHPEWSRYRLSRQLATLWDWRNPVGQLKDLRGARDAAYAAVEAK